MDQQQPEDRTYPSRIGPNDSSGSATPAYGATSAEPTVPPPHPQTQWQQQPPHPQTQWQQQPPPYGHQPQPIYVTQQVMAPAYVATAQPKSMATALLLTFFFGPLGLFYVSVAGGIVMLIVSIVLAAMTFGVSLFFTVPICMVWAAIATNNINTRSTASAQHYTQNAR